MNFLRRLFQKEKPKLVRYYDTATKTTVRIPKVELRPGVVLVKARGDSEPMYADAAELKIGAVQHSSFNEELRSHISQLAVDLADVYPQSVADWEDGFRRDRDPDRGVAGWIHLAAILRIMTSRYGYNAVKRKECFGFWSHVSPALARPSRNDLIRSCYPPPRWIKRSNTFSKAAMPKKPTQ